MGFCQGGKARASWRVERLCQSEGDRHGPGLGRGRMTVRQGRQGGGWEVPLGQGTQGRNPESGLWMLEVRDAAGALVSH